LNAVMMLIDGFMIAVPPFGFAADEVCRFAALFEKDDKLDHKICLPQDRDIRSRDSPLYMQKCEQNDILVERYEIDSEG